MKTLKKPGDVRQELSWYEIIQAMKDTTPENQELFITLHARQYGWHRRDNVESDTHTLYRQRGVYQLIQFLIFCYLIIPPMPIVLSCMEGYE